MSEVSPILMRSFAQNKGIRGVHFYDRQQCEFKTWIDTMKAVETKLPDTFSDKLIDAMANYDPESEFVTVTAGGGQLTIELFKAQTV